MNKAEFLQYLEKRLSVLNKKERQDIIAEYTQHIDMRVKEGLTEQQAIKDFGDITAFVDEILEAYNINPEYDENKGRSESKTVRTGKKIFMGAKSGIRAAAEFVFNQKPSAVIKMLFKIGIAALILLAVGFVGFWLLYNIMDGLCSAFLPEIIGIGILGLYLLTAAAVGLYILYIYIQKTAEQTKTKKERGRGFIAGLKAGLNDLVDFFMRKPKGDKTSGEHTIIRIIKDILHFGWRAVVFMFKACVAFCMAMYAAALLPAIAFVGFAFVFLVMGYPTVGLFVAGLGFCISSAALLLIVYKLVFLRRSERV